MSDTASSFTVDSQLEPDGSALLTITGDLDIATADQLTRAGHDLLKTAAEPSRLSIDLMDIRFIDSTGLGALINLREAAGGRLTLLDPSDRVIRLLQITGLTKTFEISRLIDGDDGL